MEQRKIPVVDWGEVEACSGCGCFPSYHVKVEFNTYGVLGADSWQTDRLDWYRFVCDDCRSEANDRRGPDFDSDYWSYWGSPTVALRSWNKNNRKGA